MKKERREIEEERRNKRRVIRRGGDNSEDRGGLSFSLFIIFILELTLDPQHLSEM